MDALTQLVLLCVLACTQGEPLGDVLRRHSNYGVYARDYSRDYEPYMYAAIPLHAPVPVLRILSPMPLGGRDRKHAPSMHHPVYARAPYTDSEYASSALPAYEDESYDTQHYSPAQYAVPYARQYHSSQLYAAASNTPEEPTILYARGSPHGGYTYHSAPSKPSAKRAPAAAAAAAAAADSPYIIRVHKYRIVKDL